MKEVELRFRFDAEGLPALRHALATAGASAEQPLAAVYLDSADRRLARAGLGLRLRREGRRWVQTCKGPAEDGLTRLEHNVPLNAQNEQPPAADLARHDAHPLGPCLREALGDAPLQPVFRTDIRRLSALRSPRGLGGARIEHSLDQGRLIAGLGGPAVEQPVLELELELQRGEPGALLAHAHALLSRWPLWLEVRSKAERGERLARGSASDQARALPVPQLRKGQSPVDALRTLLLGLWEPVTRLASPLAEGTGGPEQVHQLRVGLRRLRSGLRLFRGVWPTLDHPSLPAFEAQAARCYRSLGAVRDADVAGGSEVLAWRAALARALGPDAPPPVPAPVHDLAAVTAAMRDPRTQQFLVEWLGWVEFLGRGAAAVPEAGSPDKRFPSLRKGLMQRLQVWYRQLRRESRRFDQLDALGRHRLRKQCKRFLDACAFCAELIDAARAEPALKAIARAQQALGDLHDLEVALQHTREHLAGDPQAWFALGWLSARQGMVLTGAARRVRAVAERPARF